MFSEVEAVHFYKEMGNGRTRPIQIAVSVEENIHVDVVLKFNNEPNLTVDGLVREAIAAMLAADLGLNVPEPYLVKLNPPFIQSVMPVNPELAQRLSDGNRFGFGSRNLTGGYVNWSAERPIPTGHLNQAMEILAFDCLTQNADRNTKTPNVLWNGDGFHTIDHELAFIIDGVIGWRPPWESHSLSEFTRRHLFYAPLKGHPVDLSRLCERWAGITNERLLEYHGALPTEWDVAGATTQQCLSFVRNVRSHLVEATNEIKRSLQ